MKIELKPFQQVAVAELALHLRAARREANDFPQAVLLSAPTGAGKTVIATALIETLMEPDVLTSDLPTVLWLTDQPELNEQTRRKMLAHSTVLDASSLVTIEQTFVERQLAPGTVYFLNTQKLAKTSGLVTKRDARPWTLWDVIRDAIEQRPHDFIVIVDEAHRGMAETDKDREQAQSIVQRFIKGGEDIPAAPIIVGISATPDRFLGMVAGRRNLRPQVDVPVDDVRNSGLLKQTLLVYHPREKQPSDFTLLRAAAERLQEYSAGWKDYVTRAETSELVDPILVVQVDNASATNAVTATDLAMAVAVVEAVLGPLTSEQMAHAFQEATVVPIGDGRTLRYVAPSDIQDETSIRLVFFKTALTTGWDCPRAEVMMSFRKAVDHTNIAQLVGRMVRTPLARTVEDDEFLNTVSLYLPHYDKAGLSKVLGRLQQDDPEFLPPIEVRGGHERVSLHKAPDKDRCFQVLAKTPTYDVVRIRATSNVRRAVKLARLLDRDKITTGASESLQQAIVARLQHAREALEPTDWWKDIVKDAGTIDLRTVAWAVGVGTITESNALVPITQQNVDDLFAAAGRRIGEGLHKAYWRARSEQDPDPNTIRRIAKLEIFALTQHPETEAELEQFAESEVARLQGSHGADVDALPPDRKDGYRQVRLTAHDPLSRPLDVFEHIEGKAGGDVWADHLYVDASGEFSYDFKSSWEPLVLKAASKDPDFIGWLRIEDRKDWALTIPYTIGSEIKPLYPDFLVFRSTGKKVVVDILDPHDPGRDDWRPKVRGLAQFAAKHWPAFGKIEASFVEKGVIKRLDLAVETNRNRALQVEGDAGLRDLFS